LVGTTCEAGLDDAADCPVIILSTSERRAFVISRLIELKWFSLTLYPDSTRGKHVQTIGQKNSSNIFARLNVMKEM
jgi:hypothetical protein